MGKLVVLARVLMGGALLVFGLNFFLHFFEPPEPTTAEGRAFIAALIDSDYLMPLKAGVEVVAGAFILAGLFVPLGLVIYAPILVNIVLFHVYLTPPFPDGALAFGLLALELFLAWAYAGSFRGLLSMTAGSRYRQKPA